MDNWHGKEGSGTADLCKRDHTEIAARHAQAKLSDTAAHGGKLHKIGIDDKPEVPLSVTLITARIQTFINSTVYLRAWFYIFTNTQS